MFWFRRLIIFVVYKTYIHSASGGVLWTDNVMHSIKKQMIWDTRGSIAREDAWTAAC